MGFFGLVTAIAAIISGLVFFGGMAASKGAPQEAAIAGMALAIAVIPYVLFRVVQLYEARTEERTHRKHVLKRLEAIELLLSERPQSVPIAAPAPLPGPGAMSANDPLPQIQKAVVRTGPIDGTFWKFEEYDDGSVMLRDGRGVELKYSSVETAKRELGWWK